VVQSEATVVQRAGRSGELVLPERALALVLIVDARAPRRVGARERQLAAVLQQRRLATLRSDALNTGTGLAGGRPAVGPAARIDEMLDWVATQPLLAALRVGILATGAAAAAALHVAARRPGRVAAVVARDGKPDLGSAALRLVQAATLLIVGGNDLELLALNRALLTQLGATRRLEIVPGANRGFKEPGALDTMAHLACAWFETHLSKERNR
jgi:putative phosphoribosyl transferase